MLSPPDMAIIGVLALIFFGPDQLPKVARKAGNVIREVQNTSQSFIREMERAADDLEMREAAEKAYDFHSTPLAPGVPVTAESEPAHAAATDVEATSTHDDASGI